MWHRKIINFDVDSLDVSHMIRAKHAQYFDLHALRIQNVIIIVIEYILKLKLFFNQLSEEEANK